MSDYELRLRQHDEAKRTQRRAKMRTKGLRTASNPQGSKIARFGSHGFGHNFDHSTETKLHYGGNE